MKTKINKIHLALAPICLVLLVMSVAFYRLVLAGGQAQWPNTSSPSPVSIATGTSASQGARTSDGYYIIATDTGLQKINLAGAKQWNSGDPVTISGMTWIGEVIADDNGGAFIQHAGPTVSSQNEYVSHIDSSGTVNWTAGPFNDTATNDYWPRIQYDGNGGVFFTWSTTTTNYRVYLTHLGSDGDVCDVATCGVDWNSGGSGTYRKVQMPVPTGSSSIRPEPRLIMSNSNNLLVSYMTSTGVVVTSIGADGSFNWSGIPTYGNYQKVVGNTPEYLMAEPDGSYGVYLAYSRDIGTTNEIYLAKVNSSGTITMGPTSVKSFTDSIEGINSMSSAGNSNGDLFLAWNYNGPDDHEVYLQKYNSAGEEQWTSGGIVFGTEDDGYDDYGEWIYTFNLPHYLVADSSGGVIAAAMRQGSGIYNAVVVQRIFNNGIKEWGANGVVVSPNPGSTWDDTPNLINDGSLGVVVSWADDSSDVVAQYIKAVPGPTVTDIDPNHGPVGGGNTVTVTGTGFVSGIDVRFDGTSSSSVTYNSSTEIEALVPAHAAGTVNVEFENPDTGLAVQVNGYTYNASAPGAPVLNSISAVEGEADLTWSAPASDGGSSVIDYQVQYGTTAGSCTGSELTTYNNTSNSDCTQVNLGDSYLYTTIDSLTNGTQYNFVVFAINNVGAGDASNVENATPIAMPSGYMDIHIQSVDTQGDYVTVGVNDGNTGSDYINSLNTPQTALTPSAPTAVRYTFTPSGTASESSTTFELSDMTGASTLSVALDDEDLSEQLSIGFNVNMFGRLDNVLKIHADGLLFLNNSSVAYTGGNLYSYIDEGMNSTSINGTSDHVIATWIDLEVLTAGEIKYKTFGTTPNRIFVVEFDDVNYYGETGGGNTYQFKFYESDPNAEAGNPGEVPTSTNVDNEVPVFTVQPSDNGSDGTTPTNVGNDVTFTATASDPNKDNYYLAICKTNQVTAGSSAAPTCPGGTWAISSSTADDAEASVTYTAQEEDAQSNDWYAFVCDGNGTPGLCSSSSTGDAPFKVNHAGTFGTVVTDDGSAGTIEPGDTVTFRLPAAQLADSDTDTTQDTMMMHICGASATGFDYSEDSCIGDALICSSSAVNPTTTEANCADTGGALTSIPTAHGSYNFKVYVEDGHDFPATGTNTQSYTVQDVAPVLASYTATDSVEGTIIAGGSDTLTRAVTFTDNNGDNDPTLADMVVFDSNAVTDACTSDENNCYRFDNEDLSGAANCTVSDRSTAGTGKTATGTDNSLTLTCDFEIFFNANDSSDWEVSATITDGTGDTNFADSVTSTTIAPLAGIGIVESGIAYGTVTLGGDSAGQTITMENLGNQINDILVSGTNMTSGGNTIAAAQQKWHHTSSTFDWSTGGGYSLVTSATPDSGDATGCLNRDMAVRAVHDTGTEDEAIYWRIHIPAAQESGSYTGTNTFATAASDSCTGTGY